MPVEDPGELGRVDREIRINELKHQAEELAGGDMAVFESEDAPPELLPQPSEERLGLDQLQCEDGDSFATLLLLGALVDALAISGR